MFAALRARARALKREVSAIAVALRDPRTPWTARVVGALVIAYALSPIDLIPDFVPVLGYLDDLLLLPLGIWVVIALIPADVLAQARRRAQDEDSKPVSWLGAACVVSIWLVAVASGCVSPTRPAPSRTSSTPGRPSPSPGPCRPALRRTTSATHAHSLSWASALHIAHRLLDQLALVERQLHNAEERLDALTRKMPVREVLEGVDGIGLRQAASLIRFAFNGPLPDRDTAGVLLGASPVFVGSARNQKGQAKGHARLRRSAPAGARRTTYLLGRLASMHLRWGAAMYADGRARGQKPATAYRRIARSLLRILTACVRNGTPYDEDRYIAILKTKGVPCAAPW